LPEYKRSETKAQPPRTNDNLLIPVPFTVVNKLPEVQRADSETQGSGFGLYKRGFGFSRLRKSRVIRRVGKYDIRISGNLALS
jgi:hypothetical protein